MIELDARKIESEDDWDDIPLRSEYKNVEVISSLKRYIGTSCDRVIIEYPYYDSDYLSTYYLFYSKKNRIFKKQCCRLHLYCSDDEDNHRYGGYITLRPTMEETKIGKTYLEPWLLLKHTAFIMTSEFEVHLRGKDFHVEAFPWMKQETDIAVCAHVAIWSILRYYGNKYNNYRDITMGDIIELMPESVGRKYPTKAVSMQQIPDVFKDLGFSPIVVRKKNNSDLDFNNELFTYIESGIPLVACMSKKNHAIALIGHGKINYERLNLLSDRDIILTSELQDTVIVQDDNIFPYQELSYNSVNPFDYSDEMDNKQYVFQDIDYLIVPLYNRMQLSYDAVTSAYRSFLNKTPDFIQKGEQYLARIYITSANSFKRYVFNSKKINPVLETIINTLEMPKFIWCVDLSTRTEYKQNLLSARFIFDSTCCNKEVYPMILFHNSEKITYYDNSTNTWMEESISMKPYDIYVNNLREVSKDD